MKKKLVIIGSGPAGLVCALTALKSGINKEDILILEREDELGGILNVCIHAGFCKNNKTGTELATELSCSVKSKGIEYMLGTTVLSISKNKVVVAISPIYGYIKIKAEAIVLATGCRERSKGGLLIGGTRPAGIASAGTTQRFINLEGYLPGKNTVIVGSTSLALVIARRLSIEGGNVLFVCDTRKKPQAEKSEIVDCLEAFKIPLKLRTAVTRVFGKERIEAVEIASLDKNGKIIKDSKEKIECDSLVYSCGFLPESELAQDAGMEMKKVTHGPSTSRKLETSFEGVFCCGNSRLIHKDVDDVMADGKKAGKFVADYLKSKKEREDEDYSDNNSKN